MTAIANALDILENSSEYDVTADVAAARAELAALNGVANSARQQLVQPFSAIGTAQLALALGALEEARG